MVDVLPGPVREQRIHLSEVVMAEGTSAETSLCNDALLPLRRRLLKTAAVGFGQLAFNALLAADAIAEEADLSKAAQASSFRFIVFIFLEKSEREIANPKGC